MPRKLKQPWLQSLEYYLSDTESPAEYNTWVGISAISASLRRNSYIDYGKYMIYPNQYIILVGPPAVGKGTAMTPVTDIIKDAQSANPISDRITAEKLVNILSDGFVNTKVFGGQITSLTDHSALIISTELPIFLQTSEWMMPLMCDMWEGKPFSYATKTKSSFVANDICVSLIGGCVPDYIRKLNKDATSAVTGGFTSRCIFVYCSERSKMIAWPSTNGNMNQLKADLIDDLKDIGNISGEFKFTTDARLLWEQAYKMITVDPFESEVMMGFKGRMKTHIFKTAMALSASSSNNMIISSTQLQQAISLINDIRDKVDITFRAIGESPMAASQERIRMYIERRKITSRSQIFKDNYRHVTDEQLTIILGSLQNAQQIELNSIGGKMMYTPVLIKSYTKRAP